VNENGINKIFLSLRYGIFFPY